MSTKERLLRKLRSSKRELAPCFKAFNRWVFLAQHNRIMFSNREVLQQLQDEYERGRRSGKDIKKEAARIVEQNVQSMSALSTKLKVRVNGNEVFNIFEVQRQLWLKCVCPGADTASRMVSSSSAYASVHPQTPNTQITADSLTASGATCLIACREQRTDDIGGIVDVFFLARDGKSVFQYQFGMSSRHDALTFSGGLVPYLLRISANEPVKGASLFFASTCRTRQTNRSSSE